MLDARVAGVVLTVGDRINRRIENFTTVVNNEIEGNNITKEDFNEMMRALQVMIHRETSGVLKRRGR